MAGLGCGDRRRCPVRVADGRLPPRRISASSAAPKDDTRVKRLLVLILPGAIGAGVVQVNLLIDVIIASLLPRGSVSFLYYADRVNQLPLGVIGVAVGTALLPLLSRQLRAGEDHNAMGSMNQAMEFALLLTVPAAAALMVIPMASSLYCSNVGLRRRRDRCDGLGIGRLCHRPACLRADQSAWPGVFRARRYRYSGENRRPVRCHQSWA